MRLPVPGPRDLMSALERGTDQVEALLGAVPRALALPDRAEVLIERASATVARVGGVVDAATAEVAALVRLVDQLPALTDQVERDVLPVLTTLGSVAPDLHELLNVSRELNEILGKIPGIGRLKRRVEEDDDIKTPRSPQG